MEQHNPVDILRKSGCTIPPDEKIGQPTLFNDGGLGYYADGYWGDPTSGERMTVWRCPSHQIMLQGDGDGPTRRDGMTFIMSNDDGDWFAEVTAGDSGLASGRRRRPSRSSSAGTSLDQHGQRHRIQRILATPGRIRSPPCLWLSAWRLAR